MNRRNFVKGAIAGTVLSVFPRTSDASDNYYLNQRIADIARRYIGRPAGRNYNSWVFGYTVLMEANARGPYYGPAGQYAWGRPITWNQVGVGDIIQFEAPCAFKTRTCPRRTYWSCGGRCTLVVLNRTGEVFEVAFMYKQHLVRYARLDSRDFTCARPNQTWFYRPQTR